MIRAFFKRLVCEHVYLFVRNIHGDEIFWTPGMKRSVFECKFCGKRKLYDRLGREGEARA